MNVSVDELAMLLGAKDIEIYSLQKQLQAALKKVEELTKDVPMNNRAKK